jgi:wyosine [tRNA(Phe)-imidazoG37] synthetase (radical SAM superfamily)
MTTKMFYEIKPVKEKLWLKVRRSNKNANWTTLKNVLCDMLPKIEYYSTKIPTRKMLVEKMAIDELIAMTAVLSK